MKLCMALSVALMAASLLAAEGVRMEARIYVESPEQAAARLGGLLGELDICTVGRTDDGREFLVVFADAEELAQVRSAGLEVEVTWPDLREKFRRMTGVDPEDRDGGRDFGYFFTYWEMIDTLRRLAALYPSIVDTFKLGPTFQNRVLWGLRISDHPTVDEPEPELFINGATHAREPLGTHACIHFAQLLCQGYGADSLVTWLVNNRETYIIPVMNPDGYVYNSDSGGSNAYWRKNRRGPVPPAIGIDLNRNYGYKWGYDNAGSSPTPASETYRGPSRFSEPETQLARDFMYAHQFRTSQDFHTYGRYNLYSWGYRNRMPDDSLVLKEMGDTFRVNNGYTLTGPIYRTIYPVNGNSVDYAQADTLKDSTTERKFITYGFCSELGINDFWYGWNLPAYVDSEVTKNVPNLYYLARVSGVFFDPQRVLVNDSAEGNRTLQLDPNEVANLWFRVRNRAIHPLDSAYQVTGRLISLDTMVIVQDSIKPFPLCRRRDSTDNRAAQFRVYCRRGTNPNRVVPLRLELTYRDDTLTMMQPVAFTITIGANPIYVHDVGCTRLLAPAGTLDSGANVTPACSVYNYGDVVENYQVRMRIGSLYYRSVSVVGHLPGTATYVTFPNWNALPRGTLGVTCSTELAGDRIPANDQVSGSVTVRVRDVGCTRIIAPVDTIPFGTPVSPRAMVMNFGTVAATFTAKFTIGAFYRDSTTITNLAPGDSTAIAFAQWPADTAGKFAVRCSTRLPGDQVPVNDAAFDSVFVRLIDVSVMEIVVPRGGGMADSGAIVTPRCSVANYGNVRLDSLDVDLYIGPHYFCTGRARFWPPGGRGEVVFPKPCTLAGRGWWPMRCSTKLAGDQIPANDRKRDSVFLRVRDVAAVRVLSPLGVILPGPVIPSAEVHNYGNLREPCQVFFRINSSPAYLDSVALPNGLPFADTTLSFTSWNSSSGAYVACCSTGLTGDMIPANDTASARFVVGTVDVSVTAILAPVGWFDTSELQIPRAKAKNLGTAPVVNVKAIFAIDSTPGNRVYLDTVTFDLGAGAEVIATFDAWPKPYVPREYASSCYVVAPGDGNPANDTLTGRFVATSYPPGWQEMSPVPAGAKAVKDGGWLTYDAGTRLIYAARGNRRPDFLSYNPLTDSWKSLTPWPPGNEAKLPGKGSAGTADGRGHVYAVKGNNSLGFWRYDAESNTWTQLKNVPLGGGKKVKGGAGIVWAHKGETGSPYLLKGYKNEFYRYDVATDSWMTLPPAPAGARPKYDKGSWLAYDGLRTIYAHKAKFHEFYGYDLEEDAWSGPLTPMPMGGSAGAKKAKDGSCAAFAPLGLLYAFKGGNTREFWQCELAHDGQQWSEQEMIPEGAARKKVKAGASLAATGIELFALKGNKSNEFWRYVPGAQVSALPPRDGVTADQAALPEYRMLTTPNPLTSGLATVRFFVTPGAPAALRLYDAAGRYLQSAIYNRQSATLDLRSLPAGVYLLRLESGGLTMTQKLVLSR